MALFRDGVGCETREGIRVRKGVPIGWSDEIYERAQCPLCRLLVEIGDTNMSGDEREVEFWSIITVKGHEVISNVGEPLYEMADRYETGLDRGPSEAIYLALVRSIKPPPRYGFDYRTIFKDMTYIGLLGAEELIPARSLALRRTGHAAEVVPMVRQWLERCSRHESCRARIGGVRSYPDGFRLFDITTLRVVDSKGQEPYIALSYVWAQVDRVKVIKQGKPYALDTLPKVLQDVVSVIRGLNLGITHIWMDQLCVDQEDLEQRRKSIRAMGTIYGAAFATIILAVPPQEASLLIRPQEGSLLAPSQCKPEQGLPGLSVPRKPWQRVETVGKLKLATTPPNLEMAISTSLWNTRGWTLEEGILSSRCILFGPEQVYYECAEMARCESIQELSLAPPERDHLIPYQSRLQNPFLRPYTFNALYWRLVRDYTGRDMTHVKDALNAFSAFTAEFARSGHRFLWGLPATGLVRHLLWEHDPSDFRDIDRRGGFPSWSWAGWCGSAAMFLPFDALSTAHYTCTVTEEPPLGRVLECNARTADVGIEGQAPFCSLVGASVSSFMIDCGIYAGESRSPQVCTLMEVCRIGDKTYGLLVERRGDAYERIGSGFAKTSDLEAAGLEWQKLRLT